MAAASEFSTMLSRQVSQRLHLSISPLTEANLYKHTITASPPSKDAKLKHILSYVEVQRELIALEEERHRSVIEKSRSHPTRSDLSQESHGSQGSPHYRHSQQPQPQPQPQPQQQEQHPEDLLRLQKQQLQRELSLLNSRRTSKPSQWCASPSTSTPAAASAPFQQTRHHYGSPRHLDYIPDGLDPSMALPRGLPRTTTHLDHNIYRDSFYSGIGQENDWRQLEQLDPDSLAGIHIYGDTTDLQQQPSPVSASYKYSGMGFNFNNAFAPTSRNAGWRGQSLQHQQPNHLRQHQSPEDEDDEFRAEITARHSRQPTHQFHEQEHLQQQQPRQLASPASTFVEKERKLTRFSSRFSFLNRRRQTQDHQQHHRNDSMPTSAKDAWSPGSGSSPSQQRFPSLTIRPLGWSTTREETGANGESRPRVETPTSKAKGNNRVKQIFKEVLSLATKKKGRRSPEPPFRDISLPSTYIRATPSPLHLHNQDSASPYSPNHYATTLAQRKGLVTPVSRTDTAPSNYHNDNTHINTNINNGISNNNINSKNTRNARESLVDPIQPHLAFQQLDLGDDDDELANKSPFGQTSLTPPPVSSVLRHSASSHHLFGHGLVDEPTFISPEATEPEPALPLRSSTLGEVPVARPSSQLMPVTKEIIDSGCDSMGGQEHQVTTSNTTTFNPSQSQQIPNNPGPSQPERERQPSGIHPFDDDRRVSMSAYDHGAKVMAIAQVQKVDLEGLRQSHHHHSPPIHSHSLNMVTVEAPFA